MRGVMVSIDLETTGLDVSIAHIIEVGAVQFRDHEIIDTYSTLVDPGIPIPPKITAITGIRQENMLGAPKLNEVIPRLRQFVGSAPVIGHNVDFDLGFLQKQGVLADNVSVDTYEMASVLLPRAPRYNLNALMQWLKLAPEGDYHRALADALATARVYMTLWDKLVNELPLELLREIVAAAQKLPWKGAPAFADALEARAGSQIGNPSEELLDVLTRKLGAARQDWQPLEPMSAGRLDAEQLGSYLGEGGCVAEALSAFQFRAQQVELVKAVCEVFNDQKHLIMEAAPGTGRSLAYLLPAVTYALQNGQRVVASVNTTSLQNQLLNRDIPLLKQALGRDFNAVLLKGRNDYLCPRRLQTLRRRLPTSVEELRVFAKILIWLNEGGSGESSELSLRGPAEWSTWKRLSAQDEECTPDRCEQHMNGICPFYRAHRSAESAHIIVVNHELLLSDALTVSAERRVLPDYQHVIIDEAHSLEEAITNSLSFRLDATAIKRQLADLGTNRTGLLGDVLASTKPVLPEKFYDQIKGFVAVVTDAVKKMGHHVDSLFAALMAFLETTSNLRSGDYIIQVRLSADLRNKPAFSQVKAAWAILSQFTTTIAEAMARLATSLRRLEGRFDVPHLADMVDGVEAAARHLGAVHNQLSTFVGEPNDNMVYWIEVTQNLDAISIHGAPLQVGSLIKKGLWDARKTVIMIGPTLRTSGSFSYLRQQLGAEEVREVALTSPFDYEKSTLIYLPTDMPEPQDRNRYQQYVERGIIELATATQGRLLALFTGYTQLRQVAQNIAPRLALGDITVFDQSDGTSRESLLEGFKSTEKAVLLGTRSFWEDLDLPPNDLVALVIVRLPFAVPSDPVFAARGETFENSFDQYTVPDAILRFRQGFDRLIRNRTDRGVVAIFDKRMISKSYGQAFLDSLPICTVRRAPMAELGAAAREWLSTPLVAK